MIAKTFIATLLVGFALTTFAPAAEVVFARPGIAITAPDGWLYEAAPKATLSSPDRIGKIQAYSTSLANIPLNQVVQIYYDSVFKNAESPRPGHPIVLLESGEFETASGLRGVKGAFGYSQGANGAPEVWTWRYFFQKPDGKIVSVCSFVYGDTERAKSQEAIIADTLRLIP